MDIVEGHPIPQDITGFQFRIIGDLTIKQFAYLALSLILGWLLITIPLPLLIKIPFAILVVGTGILFAFIPIQGRSADTMVMLFIRALFNANEYTYQKQQLSQPQLPMQQASTTQAETTATTPMNPLPATLPVAAQDQPPSSSDHPAVHESGESLEKQLQDSQQEKQRLEEQLLLLQQQLQQKQQTTTASPITAKLPPQTPLSAGVVKNANGTPVSPDVPNLILGVVKDSRGNILPNILIEVKDKDDNPVRAFKTNPQGQFASATPLLNGTYIISFEDPKKQQQFDTIEITADGTIIPPLEVISVDERENLRKSLFGG